MWQTWISDFMQDRVYSRAIPHLFSVERPTPKSDATCLLVIPLVNAIRTASARNLSVRFSPIVQRSCCGKCYQRIGVKPRQVLYSQFPGCAGRMSDGSTILCENKPRFGRPLANLGEPANFQDVAQNLVSPIIAPQCAKHVWSAVTHFFAILFHSFQ